MDLRFRKALRLEIGTIIYNFVEAGASLVIGKMSGSIALIGFGLDSIVENLSGFILVWRLRKHGIVSQEEEERIEGRASQFVGISFFLLGAYILFESVRKMVQQDAPDPAPAGIVIAVLSLIIMPFLARAKLRLGREMGLRSLVADSKETLVCAWLSLALLIGLSANALFGFWVADPIVGICIAGFLFREGRELIVENSRK